MTAGGDYKMFKYQTGESDQVNADIYSIYLSNVKGLQ